VIKEAGVVCVIAKSFARIFYRNAFNIGLALVEANTDYLKEGDQIAINLDQGLITEENSSLCLKFKPWDSFRKELIDSQGILNYLKKHKGFKIKAR